MPLHLVTGETLDLPDKLQFDINKTLKRTFSYDIRLSKYYNSNSRTHSQALIHHTKP